MRWGANATPAKLHQLWPRRQQAYTTEEVYELEEDEAYDDFAPDYAEAEEVYYEDTPEGDYDTSWDAAPAEETDEGYYQTEDAGDSDGALEEAYAAYLDARRQFANLPAARGYFPVVALAPEASGSGSQHLVSSSSGKGKGKQKGKGSSSKGRGKNAYPPCKGSSASRATAYFGGSANCFICGKAGHLAAQCPSGSPVSKGASSSSPSKRIKTADAMMVTDTALHAEEGVPHLGPRGWHGIQDGGASSMVIGHNTLMKVIDHMGEHGVKTSRFLFHPVDKVFAFGGDARCEAQWSVRLPIYVQNQHGYAECFVVDGDTPLLVGRLILSALQVKTDFATNTISVLDSEWMPAVVGERGKYLLRLDDGVELDKDRDMIVFDYITESLMRPSTTCKTTRTCQANPAFWTTCPRPDDLPRRKPFT